MLRATRNGLFFTILMTILLLLTLAIFIVSSRFNPANRQEEVNRLNKLPVLGDYPGLTVEMHDAIVYASTEFGVDTPIIKAVIKVESGFDPLAVSKKGAKGLMQLMPGTAWAMGVKNAFNPKENIYGGTRYLELMVKRFNDIKLALAAYNLGPTKVAKLLKNGFDPSTYKYVQKVKAVLNLV